MTDDPSDGGPGPPRCDFCRLPIPVEPIGADYEGVAYEFCSEGCRAALADSERVFATYHGYRTVRPGLAAMDASLPEGMPRNAFVLLSGASGTRDRAVRAELAWRALRRGERVVLVSFLETPLSVVQEFVQLEWNVLPYLETGRLRLLDCFSSQLAGAAATERLSAFNEHVNGVVREATTTVQSPTDLALVRSRLDDCLSGLGPDDPAIVVIDSLTELGSLVQPVRAYDFVKRVRAEVAKARFVPVIAGATRGGDAEKFPHDLEYMVDGIVDLRFVDDVVPNTLIKQLRVRKMAGVLIVPEWHTYEYTAGTGQVVFDPEEEAASDGTDGSGKEDGAGGEGSDGGSAGGEDGHGNWDGEGGWSGEMEGDGAGG
jgi:KaiC/GvpD/RAD55 family RecA-like ATPase